MFKKDDYIVILGGEYSDSFPLLTIFKQRDDSSYLRPYLDCKNDKFNGWSVHPYNKSYENDWRYATYEEIQEYDRLEKPFDTTLLIPPLYEIY